MMEGSGSLEQQLEAIKVFLFMMLIFENEFCLSVRTIQYCGVKC